MNLQALLAGLGTGAIVGLPIGWVVAKIVVWRENRGVQHRRRPAPDHPGDRDSDPAAARLTGDPIHIGDFTVPVYAVTPFSRAEAELTERDCPDA